MNGSTPHTPGLGSLPHEPYLATLVAGSPRKARFVLEDLLNQGHSVAAILEDVLTRAMESIGDLWQEGLLTVAQEHLASAMTEAQLAWLAPLLPVHASSSSLILLAGTPGELHGLGLRMLADVLSADGWRVLNLGSSVPEDDLVELVARRRPDVVGLSTALTTHLRDTRSIAAKLHALPDPPVVLLGGAAYLGNEDLAKRVGADLYASNAPQALELLRPMLERGLVAEDTNTDADVRPRDLALPDLRQFETASAARSVGVARLDMQGRILAANAAFERLAGGAVVGLPLESLVADAQRALVRKLVTGARPSWSDTFLGFAQDEEMVPVDRAARVGRVGGEVVVVIEPTTAEADRVNEGLLALVRDLVETQRSLETKTTELKAALDEVRSARLLLRKVQGILPICMACGRVRDDDDRHWVTMREYIAHTDAIALSHTYCPTCAASGPSE